MNTLLELAREGRPLTGCEIIDTHGHLGRYAFAIPELTPESLVRSLDRVGVSRIICSHMRCMSADFVRGNNEVLAAMRAFPGRILGYATVWPTSPETTAAEIERCFTAGFTGVKLHNSTGFPYTHPAYHPAYALAHELRRPVLFHTWGGATEFAEISELSRRYPDAVLLAAHGGCSNEAGYIQLARECPNVYLDFAVSFSPRGVIERFVAALGAERLVWGSDAYYMAISQQLGRIVSARISEEERRIILSQNALSIFARMRPIGTTVNS